ncbi:synaptic vesicle glycoprotein 2B isoform X2 [Periophthalmus magnuspinnatus]|uniref:synaptic vesicle glycoprotein 2B isoform X2 n=1 Tax=Periophthalmus magnuspinnatus TaxID=409849 RepID=UPI002436B68D|nr:synaptic vesicle glycoprotein 2B isoform X2 [Periophthalmus magnuspinnatus]
MSRHVFVGDAEAEEPLLANAHLETNVDSDDGEVIFDRTVSTKVECVKKKYTFEEAVDEAGFGLFHWLLLVVCGWANASDAVEIMCVSFLLPTARCDLRLSSSDMGILTASIFLGMMVGGYMWGYLADQRGRCRVLVVSLSVNGVFGGLASVAPGFWLFLLLRFISGIGVGGSIPVIFSYFSEFLPRLRRGAMISALATFWMAGNILAAGLAWWVIPQNWAHFESWRLFVVLCSVPSLSSALLFKIMMPESPKFLMEAGEEKEAACVFQLMFKLNTWGKGKKKQFALCVTTINDNSSTPLQKEQLIDIYKKALSPIREMFKGVLRTRSTALLIVFYCISFGFYGLWMWFPELFKRVEDGGSPCANVSRSYSLQNESCYPVKTAIYMEGFFIAASNLPGNIFTILMMDSIGGKALLSHSLLLSCVFSGVSVISWNALDVMGTELYPTHLRSSALGFFTGVGRVAAIMGNVVFGRLLDSHCAVPVLLVSGLLLTGGLIALLLPQTKQTELT